MSTAQFVIDRAEILLQDTDNDRFDEADLLIWLSDAQKEVVKEKPDANPVFETVQLDFGSLQQLPDRSIQLLDVLSNKGTDNFTIGRPITTVDRVYMDAMYPNWRTEDASTDVIHVIYDPKRLPKNFWIYPSSLGNNFIEIITAKLPVDLTELSEELTLPEEYDTALLHYIMFMAHTVDAEYAESREKAIAHYSAFLNLLGVRDAREEQISSKRTRDIA